MTTREVTTRRRWNRRRFLSVAGCGAAGWLILGDSRSVWSYHANEKLNVGVVGAGGWGAVNLARVAGENVEFAPSGHLQPAAQPQMTGENIVALCDVDERGTAESSPGRRNPPGDSLARYPRAKKFHDYRKMLDDLDREIDAVVVSTPHHIHALASVAAMRQGKHVYCEKAGANTVHEARVAAEVARQQRVATQLGTQMHASDNYRRILELLHAGAIGPVREFHIYMNAGGSPGDRPAETPPVPAGFDWDLFLGPAPYRPYHPVYHGWHSWWDFGAGIMGNMGCHYFDLPFWALELRHPVTIEAQGPPPHPESTPAEQHVRYEFPARGELPPVTLTWTHGSQPPPIFVEHAFPSWVWGVFVGSEGMLLADYSQWQLWPEAKFADYQPPEPSIPSSIGHHAEWIAACKTGSATSCHFGYSGPITEAVLLGTVAYRSGTKLEWDAAQLRVTNCPEANHLLRREYRPGWSL
jgi:predicted dehydrogenase